MAGYAQEDAEEAEDDRAYLTMYTSNTATSPHHGESSSARPGGVHLHFYTGRTPPGPSVITENLPRARLGDFREGEITRR